MSTANGTRRGPRTQPQAISADKIVVNLEGTSPRGSSRRGVSSIVSGAHASPIDVEAIDDEVQAVSPSQVPPPRRNRRTRRQPVTVVDLEVDSSQQGPDSVWSSPPHQSTWNLAPAAAENHSTAAPCAMSQRPEEGGEKSRLRAALRHLKAEARVLERMLYKHRNQHRGAAYFQYLLKVRRDLKLLLSAGLTDVVNAVFPVLASRKPANAILVPTKQIKKKPGANHSHHVRLLGIARLLSQMAEPVMKAAIQITFLLGRSFFIDLCTAVLALLARVRVLIQQMLLDVVSVYNRVTNLTNRKHEVKISVAGVQAFREYYPSIHDGPTVLECVWVKDKFILHEKMKGSCQETENEDQSLQRSCGPETTIQYETLGFVSEEMKTLEETKSLGKQADAVLVEHPDNMNHCSDTGLSRTGKQLENESNTACSLPDTLTPASSVPLLDLKPVTKKRVAFIAVGNPKRTAAPSETKSSDVNKKRKLETVPRTAVESGDLFKKLLDSENPNNTLL